MNGEKYTHYVVYLQFILTNFLDKKTHKTQANAK